MTNESNKSKCQVYERPDTWPYIEKCTNDVGYQIQYWIRQLNPRIEAEYVCEMHADLLIEQYGNECVTEFPNPSK
jgi:hypothetical protein